MLKHWSTAALIIGILSNISLPMASAEEDTDAFSISDTTTEEAPSAASQPAAPEGALSRFWGNYFNIFYGPAVGRISSFQSTPDGEPTRDRPIFFKNFLTLGYNVSEKISVSGTAYWIWRPVQGSEMMFRDPSLRVSFNQILHTDNFNLYGDARIHFAVSDPSRQNDMLGGAQSVQIMTYRFDKVPVTLASYTSVRASIYGQQGWGNDVELYFGPNVSIQLTKTLAFSLLYEMGASHALGDDPTFFVNDGTALEPGLFWDITPKLTLNPYLNIYTGNKVTWNSTSFGMTLNWQLF